MIWRQRVNDRYAPVAWGRGEKSALQKKALAHAPANTANFLEDGEHRTKLTSAIDKRSERLRMRTAAES
jgi:hypothetical protein